LRRGRPREDHGRKRSQASHQHSVEHEFSEETPAAPKRRNRVPESISRRSRRNATAAVRRDAQPRRPHGAVGRLTRAA
jgi:hypothetical protein